MAIMENEPVRESLLRYVVDPFYKSNQVNQTYKNYNNESEK